MDLLTKATVEAIIKALPGKELVTCVQAVIKRQDKGAEPSSALRSLAVRFEREAGIHATASGEQVEASLLREAALRFLAQHTGLRGDE